MIVNNKMQKQKTHRVKNTVWSFGSSIAGFLCATLLVLPSSASADTDWFLNLGVEGGLSKTAGEASVDVPLSIRGSLAWRA